MKKAPRAVLFLRVDAGEKSAWHFFQHFNAYFAGSDFTLALEDLDGHSRLVVFRC